MHNAHDTKATLVLGGADKNGRRVTARLMQRRVPVRVSSRSGVPPFDWEDRVTWTSARRDVGAVDVIYQTDGVRRALGREPREVAESVHNMATSGVWGTQR
jgi:uncharacterized protein YbjT (DUF2867 family)